MKEKICKKLKELAKKPVRRVDWSGERWFVRRYKQGLALAWIVYFLLREELVKEILKPVGDYLMDFLWIQWPYVNRLTILLVSTFLLILAKIIFSILRRCEVIRYFPLDKKKYPEYDFSFQEELLSFLNREKERGRNIFWLDGSWGSGKTHFIRTFFENQFYKPHEIYYISCFGIRTREQVEKVLVDEIEQHSTFGSLDHIPVISSLVKWAYKILGLDLMKKHSLIIFDDLERVTYSEKQKDNPEDYNDLLGFIDHLANHRNQKILVLMNRKDMENTYQQIVEEKFKPIVTNIPNQEDIIKKMTEEYDSVIQELVRNIYLFQHEFGTVNLRGIAYLANLAANALQEKDDELEPFVEELNIRIRKSMKEIIHLVCPNDRGDYIEIVDFIKEMQEYDQYSDQDKLEKFEALLKVLEKVFNSDWDRERIFIDYDSNGYRFNIYEYD
ncbi:KAP family NTPase [Streptococcus suis]|uniref:KAP family NTPase n=1 Tax=Streptococcus suis TaxID=1307 RepID=UPI001EDE478B|nr:KAP family NTPase [Streptococcus suis]